MKVRVDQETCIGCGLCVDICPEVFRMSGDKAIAGPDPVPENAKGACRRAVEDCPVSAIDVTE